MAFPPENITKNFVTQIHNECCKSDTSLDFDFIEFYLKLCALNPDYGKYFTTTNSDQENEEFLKHCVEKLSDETNPSNLMLKMQLGYEKDYDTLDNLIFKNQENIDKRTQPLVKEILEARPKNSEDYEKLLRRISICIVLKSGLGNPGNIQVLREGTSALNSVFTMDDLKNFVDQKNQFKEKQLAELLCIISGIRIFNKDCRKGGESIPDLTSNLPEAAEATSLALSHCLIRIMERVNLLTTSIDTYILINPDAKSVQIIVPTEKNVDIKDYSLLCKILAIYRQYEVLVRKLIVDMDSLQVENKELCLNFSTHMYDLHSLVRFRTAVPADQVFPYFIRLWNYWRGMQNNMFLISAINNLMWNLDTVHEKLDVPLVIVDAFLNGRRVISDAQRLKKTEECRINYSFTKCAIVFPNDQISDDAICQYLGFCGLCICIGALIPANPSMGLLKWKKKCFAFCSIDHAIHFGSNPTRYVKEALDYIRNNVELINFLQIYDEIFLVRQLTSLTAKRLETTKTEDKEVQTELHPIPSYIDKNYCWNIWEYKKKACQLARIINCRTHSTQTHFSISKVESGSQTVKLVNKGTQQTRDVETFTEI